MKRSPRGRPNRVLHNFAALTPFLAARKFSHRVRRGLALAAPPLHRTAHGAEKFSSCDRLTPGSKLGSYEILAPLDSGGMGDVFRR